MKRLILIRHAKSSWEFNVIDHERPLKNRGINDAHMVSKYLKQMKLSVDKILSSDAVRTKLTANIFVKNLGLETLNVEFKYKLYDFEGRDLLQTVKKCDNKINSLMVFGHNHAITALVNTYGNKFVDNVPTSGVVILDFNINDWNKLAKGKTLTCIFPKDLKV